MNKSRLFQVTFSVAVAVLMIDVACAGGFQVYNQSVSGLGTSTAHQAAVEDATTAYWNPAGMVYLPQRSFTLGVDLIKQHAEFKNKGSTTFLPPPNGVPLGGGSGGDSGDVSPLPHLFYTQPLGSKGWVGFSLTFPFGLGNEYDDDWVGRYHALKSELRTINLNPAFAYKITNSLSIGAGVSAQYAKVTLTNALDFSTICLGAAQNSPALGPQCVSAGFNVPGNAAKDGKVNIEGDDWSYGFNLGLMYQPAENLRFGFAYRSNVKHTLKGDASFDKPAGMPAPIANSAQFTDGAASAAANLPETISVNGMWRVRDWTLVSDVAWVRWSRFDEQRIKFGNGAPDSVTPARWKNTLRVAVGAIYQLNPTWKLRTGFALDRSPVPDEFRTPRTPDEDRLIVGLGANYQFSERSTFDVGYSHVFLKDASIDLSTSPAAGRLVGTFPDSSSDIVGLQWNYTF